jgi:hypothetical protein
MKKRFFVCLIFLTLLAAPYRATFAGNLGIKPVIQKTPVWCWLAVGEMVFKYYGVPNVNPAGIYQCGIIGSLVGVYHPCNRDCSLCEQPARSLQNIQIMLRTYPVTASQANPYLSVPPLRSESKYTYLSEAEIRTDIDDESPIIAGINPSGFATPGSSQHVALIVGYEQTKGKLILTVNDPFPFDLGTFNRMQNPYVAAGGTSNGDGSYEIEYGRFRRGLQWNTTIFNISR